MSQHVNNPCTQHWTQRRKNRCLSDDTEWSAFKGPRNTRLTFTVDLGGEAGAVHRPSSAAQAWSLPTTWRINVIHALAVAISERQIAKTVRQRC
jgi:hypothetical protein